MPAPRPTAAIAADMSPTRLPATAALMPAARASYAVLIRRASASRGAPTVNETAASPVQPASVAPASMLTRSPSASRYFDGIPCSAASLMDVQITAGNGGMFGAGW